MGLSKQAADEVQGATVPIRGSLKLSEQAVDVQGATVPIRGSLSAVELCEQQSDAVKGPRLQSVAHYEP